MLMPSSDHEILRYETRRPKMPDMRPKMRDTKPKMRDETQISIKQRQYFSIATWVHIEMYIRGFGYSNPDGLHGGPVPSTALAGAEVHEQLPDAAHRPKRPSLVKMLWKPEVYFPNAKESDFQYVTVPNVMLRIHPDGTILYILRYVMPDTTPTAPSSTSSGTLCSGYAPDGTILYTPQVCYHPHKAQTEADVLCMMDLQFSTTRPVHPDCQL
ncbi:Glycine receptor subunit beta-type 4-like 1 [Homarus americanus]|uniref:Glycine receptor subunit beta-type 4-like 1 n=1 Tax=Homarus americanus TaxID=6706 RepID=A0A8J5TL38_HOMAM|nr:Glycine receptor subunit beta-type 4-like 1 [Homarus americanus]